MTTEQTASGPAARACPGAPAQRRPADPGDGRRPRRGLAPDGLQRPAPPRPAGPGHPREGPRGGPGDRLPAVPARPAAGHPPRPGDRRARRPAAGRHLRDGARRLLPRPGRGRRAQRQPGRALPAAGRTRPPSSPWSRTCSAAARPTRVVLTATNAHGRPARPTSSARASPSAPSAARGAWTSRPTTGSTWTARTGRAWPWRTCSPPDAAGSGSWAGRTTPRPAATVVAAGTRRSARPASPAPAPRPRARTTRPPPRPVTAALLAGEDAPDALVCASDTLALGAHRAVLAAGADVRVVGFDATPVAAALGLPSVAQPMRGVAHACLELPAPPPGRGRPAGPRRAARAVARAAHLAHRDHPTAPPGDPAPTAPPHVHHEGVTPP